MNNEYGRCSLHSHLPLVMSYFVTLIALDAFLNWNFLSLFKHLQAICELDILLHRWINCVFQCIYLLWLKERLIEVLLQKVEIPLDSQDRVNL